MAEFTTTDPVDVITDRFDEQSRRLNCMQNDIDCLEEMMGDQVKELYQHYQTVLDIQEIHNKTAKRLMDVSVLAFTGSAISLAMSILALIF